MHNLHQHQAIDWLWLAKSSKMRELCRCTPSRTMNVGSTLAQRSKLRRRDQSHTCIQAKATRELSVPRSTKGKEALLTLENVGRTHDGHTQLFSDVSATINRGQRLAVVGPNGCGKTTLLRLIAGLGPFQLQCHTYDLGGDGLHQMSVLALCTFAGAQCTATRYALHSCCTEFRDRC